MRHKATDILRHGRGCKGIYNRGDKWRQKEK